MHDDRRAAHLQGAHRKRTGGARQLALDVADAIRIAALPDHAARRERLAVIERLDGPERAALIRSAAWAVMRAG